MKTPSKSFITFFAITLIAMAAHSSRANTNLTVVVTANPLWTDTGIALATTDVVQVYGAAGAWTSQTGFPASGPDGTNLCEYVWDEWISDAHQGQLIGFVGSNPNNTNVVFADSPALFVVSTNSVMFTGKAGELWLGFNDAFATRFPNNVGVNDNSGAVTVNVTRVTLPQSLSIGLSGPDILLSIPTPSTNLYSYSLQNRTDLIFGSWSAIASNLTSTGGVMTNFDVAAMQFPRRFYRMDIKPVPPQAAENAANSAYNGYECGWIMSSSLWNGTVWTNGLTAATGFGPWILTATGVISSFTNGFFIGSSTNNETGSPFGIDVNDVSWGIYANSSNFSAAYRAFANGPLQVGQTFRIDMENGIVDPGGAVGFAIRNSNINNGPTNYDSQARFQFFYLGGDFSNSYKVVDAGGLQDIGVLFTRTGLHLVFTLNTTNTYTLLTIDNASNTTNSFAGTLGSATNSTLDSIALFNLNEGGEGRLDHNSFFNSMSVANPATVCDTVGTSSSPSAGGSTGGGGTVVAGSNVTVCATANGCYSFVNWIDQNSNVLSVTACYSFTVTSNQNLVANFAPTMYTIGTSSSPAGGGTTGGGTVACGSAVTVCATTNACYSFVSWTDQSNNLISVSNCYSFTATANLNLVANFAPLTNYTIGTGSSPTNGGSVSGGGTVACGSNVTLCATANSCYGLVNWTVNSNVVSTSACYSFTVASNETVVANFAPSSYTIGTGSSPTNSGSISGGGTVACGSNVTVCATANGCYNFVSWTAQSSTNAVSTNACYSFTATNNLNLVANFAPISYVIGSSSSPTNGGSISGGGTVACGSNVTVCATTNGCYSFVNWTDQNSNMFSTSACYNFTASSNRTLVANFTPISYVIGTSSSPANGGSISGGGTVACGSNVSVCATTNGCYSFANWTDQNSNVFSTSTCYNFTASTNLNLVANFAPINYTIGTSSSPTNGGSTSGGGTVMCGSNVTVCATTNASFIFVSWTTQSSTNAVSTNACYSFTATANLNLVANFVP